MEPTKMEADELSSPANRIMSADLPDDDDIKEIRQRREIAANNERDSDDNSSDCDSDAEGMEALWDALFRTDEPYNNSIEHLKKLQDKLPTRLSTREHKLHLKDGLVSIYDKRHLATMNEIFKSRLVDPDIDQEILMENLRIMRGRIKSIIRKKERARDARKNASLEEMKMQ